MKKNDLRVLRAISELQPQAYCQVIRDHVDLTVGTVYATLERLTYRGYIQPRADDSALRMCWDVTDAGELILKEVVVTYAPAGATAILS